MTPREESLSNSPFDAREIARAGVSGPLSREGGETARAWNAGLPRSTHVTSVTPERFADVLKVCHEIASASQDLEACSLVLESISKMLAAEQAVLILRNPLTTTP